MFRLTVLICFLLGYLNGFATSDSILRIVQISDVQLGFTMARSGETTGKIDSLLRDADEISFRKAVVQINGLSPAPDLIINTGDIVNNPNDDSQWQKYMEVASGLKAPVYEAMGNHDGWNPSGLALFNKRFGKDYYSITIKNCLFIVLNSWYLKHPELNPDESELQKKFAEQTLAGDHSKFRVLVMHFPAYIEKPDERDEYFNLPIEQRNWLLNLALKQKVKLILSGHSHRNIINSFRDSVTLITSGPLSEPLGMNDDKTPSVRGFRIININLHSGSIRHEFINIERESVRMIKDGNKYSQGFSFAFIGDTHYDEPQHHDMNWVLSEHPGDTSQISQYCKQTKYVLPALYRDIKSLADDHEIALVVHTGDFTEGLCGNYTLASNQMKDFINFSNSYLNVPCLLTKGNHDITGPGADSAYRNVILPYLSGQSGSNISGSMYTYIKGNMAFFFYDTYNASSLDWLENQMKKYHELPLKFVIMHEPVVPVNARSKWTEFSKPEEAGQRNRLLNILGQNRAIVLAGHLHCYGLVVRRTKYGSFIQLSGSSVPEQAVQDAGTVLEGRSSYGKPLTRLEPSFSPADKKERNKILRHEKNRIKHFEFAEVQGYIILNIKDNMVSADIYSGTGFRKWRTVELSKLLQ